MTTFKYITDPKKATRWLDKFTKSKSTTVIDTEADGLYGSNSTTPLKANQKINRLVQIYNPKITKDVILLDVDYIDIKEVVQAISTFHHTVSHNAHYDLNTLFLPFIKEIKPNPNYDCTMWMATALRPQKWLFQNKSKRLVSLLEVYKWLYGTKANPYTEANIDKKIATDLPFINGSRLSYAQLIYSAIDCVVTYKIYKKMKKMKVPMYQHKDFKTGQILNKVKDCKVTKLPYYNIDKAMLLALLDIQYNGVLVDNSALQYKYIELERNLKQIEDRFTINLNSPKQVQDYCLNKFHIAISSMAKNNVIKYIDEYEAKGTECEFVKFLHTFLDYKPQRTLISNVKKHLPYSKLYTTFNPYGTVTGRFNSQGDNIYAGFNAQNITRELQSLYEKDTLDTVVIHLDYSTAEVIAGTSIMQEHVMRSQLLEGLDPHKVAVQLVDTKIKYEDITPPKRQIGKAARFGLLFGMGSDSLVEYAKSSFRVAMTSKEARKAVKNHKKTYKFFTKYHFMKWQTYKTELNFSPTGRRSMSDRGTEAINYATQSCIADTIKLSVIELAKFEPITLDYMFNIVHDSLSLRVPKGTERYYSSLACTYMLKGWDMMLKYDMLHFKDIPLKVEYEYNDSKTGKHVVIETADKTSKKELKRLKRKAGEV